MLSARNLEVVYDDVVLALRGVSIDVPEDGIVALLGSNGAGKTTLLRALTGLLDIHQGEVAKGRVTLDDKPIHRMSPERVVRQGVRQVLEGRRVFVELRRRGEPQGRGPHRPLAHGGQPRARVRPVPGAG